MHNLPPAPRDGEPVQFNGSFHCNACGRLRRGLMNLSATAPGFAVFRCEAAHATAYRAERYFDRGKQAVRYKAMSKKGHLALANSVHESKQLPEARLPLSARVAEGTA